MMTEEQAIALGKRAVAAGWKWQAGAVDMEDRRIFTVLYDGYICYAVNGLTYYASQNRFVNNVPDFRDPATLGILLAQVRERYGDPTIHAQFAEGSWRVAYWNPDNFYWAYWPEESFDTEAEALVAALDPKP